MGEGGSLLSCPQNPTKCFKMGKNKTARILITDAFDIGYTAGREYEVDPAEAAKLIGQKKAVPVTEPQKETAQLKPKAKEKRG